MLRVFSLTLKDETINFLTTLFKKIFAVRYLQAAQTRFRFKSISIKKRMFEDINKILP